MGDQLKPLSPGDRWQPIASVLNGYQEAADYVRGLKRGGGALPGSSGGFDGTIATLKNNSGSDLDRFAVLGIDTPIVRPSDNLDVFLKKIGLCGVTPDKNKHQGKFAVRLRPIANGDLGPAAIAGVVPVRVYVNSYMDKYCDVDVVRTVGSETVYIGSGACGAKMLYWEAAGTGDNGKIVWAIVQPAATAATSFMAMITDTDHAGKYSWYEISGASLVNSGTQWSFGSGRLGVKTDPTAAQHYQFAKWFPVGTIVNMYSQPDGNPTSPPHYVFADPPPPIRFQCNKQLSRGGGVQVNVIQYSYSSGDQNVGTETVSDYAQQYCLPGALTSGYWQGTAAWNPDQKGWQITSFPHIARGIRFTTTSTPSTITTIDRYWDGQNPGGVFPSGVPLAWGVCGLTVISGVSTQCIAIWDDGEYGTQSNGVYLVIQANCPPS